jgi:hypothetical protein
MPLIPLAIPPGVYRNGTDYQSAGRWRDANLVRWHNNAMRPVGGWLTRATPTDKAIRGLIAWRDLDGDRWVASGTHTGLFVTLASGTTTEITPSAYVAGNLNAEANLGYGGGFYGTGAYGIERPDSGTALQDADSWSLDNWGEYLVACSTSDGRLLEWQLDTDADAVAITNAPTDCSALHVTEERFLFALGAGGNFRKVQWSDREDNTTWTPLATNEAGDFDLQTPGRIMLGIRARGQSLILTDQDAHTASYQGPPFVYGFERVGTACGAISRMCAASVDAGVFWMGRGGFYVYGGGAVQELPCEVLGYVFSDFNAAQQSKIAAVSNAKFAEIWWFYPSNGSTENDRYVSYNYVENHWSVGHIVRTSGADAGVFSTPIWAGSDGKIINHEIGYVYDGDLPFAESGPIQIGAGDNVMAATMLIPDERTQGQVTATFKTRFHPNDLERSYGPYTMANPTDIRFTGRQVAMRVTGVSNADWRFGIPRIEAKAGGLR